MAIPEAEPGLVVHFNYLRSREYDRGRQEARICALVLNLLEMPDTSIVVWCEGRGVGHQRIAINIPQSITEGGSLGSLADNGHPGDSLGRCDPLQPSRRGELFPHSIDGARRAAGRGATVDHSVGRCGETTSPHGGFNSNRGPSAGTSLATDHVDGGLRALSPNGLDGRRSAGPDVEARRKSICHLRLVRWARRGAKHVPHLRYDR